MKELINIVKMKIYKVIVEDSEYWVGKKGKEFFVRVFRDHCTVEEIELSSNSCSDIIVDDERSLWLH